MKVIITVKKPNAAGWVATAFREDPAKTYGTRTLERRESADGGNSGFPIPPADERQSMDPAAPEYPLCHSADGQEIEKAYQSLAKRKGSGLGVAALARYVFAVLIGERWWKEIRADLAQNEQILEFVVRAEPGDHEFSRLPWELMRHPDDGFLAAMATPLVSVTREVEGPDAKVVISPRVLFIIGTEPPGDRAVIQPMTEIAGMLRRLDELGVALHTRVLLKPTLSEIAAELVPPAAGPASQEQKTAFSPSIVHFLCHGEFDKNGGASLWLADDDRQPKNFRAEQLAPDLNRRPGGPPVVVMSACNSGGSQLARPIQESGSLAQELVELGIPLAIGMAGRVQDVACRLFTRQFYASLLTSRDVVLATAAGRFAAFAEGAPPQENIDWSMPTFFRRGNLTIEVDREAIGLANLRRNVAEHVLSARRPRYFCGRYDCWKSLQDLLDDRLPQRARVLAIAAQHRPLDVPNPRNGLTRTVQEFAAHVTLAGHLPCLVEIPKVGFRGVHWALGMQFLDAFDQSWKYVLELLPNERRPEWQEQRAPDALSLVQLSMRGQQVNLPASVQTAINRSDGLPRDGNAGGIPASVVSAAIRVEAGSLLKSAQDLLGASPLKLVVFLDGLDRLGPIDQQVVQHWFNHYGLSDDPREPIPVVVTYNENPPALSRADGEITRQIQERSNIFYHLQLARLPAPADDWMPYQQFLFSHEPPLTLLRGAPREQELMNDLEEVIRGVPSRFELPQTQGIWHENTEVARTIKRHQQELTLVVAKDDAVRELIRQRWGL